MTSCQVVDQPLCPPPESSIPTNFQEDDHCYQTPQAKRAVGRHHRNVILTLHYNGIGLGTPHLPTLHKSCHRSVKMRNAHCLWVSLAEDAENANTNSCNVERGTEAGDRDDKPSQSLGDGFPFYSNAVTSNPPIIARWEPRCSLHSCATETFKTSAQ